MKTVIWLKTARVYAQDSDMMPKVERITTKLEDGDNFKKFINHLHLKGFMKSEPPFIEKVMENQGGQWVEIDKSKWVKQLNDVLSGQPKQDEKVDYKHLSEQQAFELKQTKAQLNDLADRLAKLEAQPRKTREPKTEQ